MIAMNKVVPVGNERIVDALKRITTEVFYMLEAPTKDLIVSTETRAAFDEANNALEEIGESIEYDDD